MSEVEMIENKLKMAYELEDLISGQWSEVYKMQNTLKKTAYELNQCRLG